MHYVYPRNVIVHTTQLMAGRGIVTAHRCLHTRPISSAMLWFPENAEKQMKHQVTGALHAEGGRDVSQTGTYKQQSQWQQQQRRHQLRRSPLESARPRFADTRPLVLDPPFTPVPGEAAILHQLRDKQVNKTEDNEDHVVYYSCATCCATLFSSAEYTAASTVGSHRDGWPSFTAAARANALQLRGLLQRTAVAHANSAVASNNNGKDLNSAGEIGVPSPVATLAARGLPIEGEMTRTSRSGRCELLKPKTWREACLRDVNKRSDPALLEGCCSSCGCAICRVVTTRGGAVKYVVNPSAIVAELAGLERTLAKGN